MSIPVHFGQRSHRAQLQADRLDEEVVVDERQLVGEDEGRLPSGVHQEQLQQPVEEGHAVREVVMG